MKKILLFIILSLFPITSFGAVTYTRTPAGSGTYSSVEYTLSITDFTNDMPGYSGENWFCIGTFFPDLDVPPGVGDRYSTPFAITGNSGSLTWTQTLPEGSNGQATAVYASSMNAEDCSNGAAVGFLELEGDTSVTIFTLGTEATPESETGTIGGFNSGVTIATASTTAMLASMGFAGAKVLFALLSVAIFIILLYLGFKYGIRAMQGKVGKTETWVEHWNNNYEKLRNAGYDDDFASEYMTDTDKDIEILTKGHRKDTSWQRKEYGR